MKIDKNILVIHSLRAQKYTNKDIAKRLNIGVSTVSKITSYKQKTLSKKTEKKITASVKEIKTSKAKSNKALIKYIDYTAKFLAKSKTTRQLKATVNRLRKAESLVKEIAETRVKMDKRRKKGGKAYKDELQHFYTQISKGHIELEVF